MKRDLFILFLIVFGIDLLLGDVRYLITSENKLEALEGIFSLHNLWLNIAFIASIVSYALYTFFILSRFYPNRQIPKCIFYLAIGLILSVCLRFLLEEIVGEYLTGFGNYKDGVNLFYYFLDNCYGSFLYGAIATAYYFVKYSFKKEQEKLDLLVQNKATQLQLLKSQVNPHFLFNNLNSIYSLVYQKSENALPAIDKLSTLLRNSLYEVGQKVSIKQELNQIDNFIELQKLRSEKPLEYYFEVNISDQDITIPPLLFFPFVENAFKHGELHSMNHPILVKLDQQGSQLFFSTSNLILNGEKDGVGGIGLDNIRKRLKLLYGNKHTFEITQQDNIFRIQLQIPMQA